MHIHIAHGASVWSTWWDGKVREVVAVELEAHARLVCEKRGLLGVAAEDWLKDLGAVSEGS